MIAVVLVGGFGTRLRPLTLDTPKQMLPIVDRPMLEWVLTGLAKHGVDHVVLSLGYRPDAFQAAFPDGRCAGVELHYAVEPEPLDTAGAVRFAALDAGIDERFLVCNGDVLTDLDVTAFIARHEAAGAEGSIALHRVEEPSRYGVVPTDPDGRVEAFVEKPAPGSAPTDRINAGTYVLEPSVLARIPSGRRVSIERETFPGMVEDRSLFAFSDGDVYWLDTGTPEAYLAAQLDYLDGRRGVAVGGVAPTARIDAAAKVERSVVMHGAVVAAGATVRDSVVGAGSAIGEEASVRDSILAGAVRVGAGASLSGHCVIGTGQSIDAGTVLHGVRLPEPA